MEKEENALIYIGCHLSVTEGFEAMGRKMLGFGGDTFAFFTRNPRGGRTKETDPADAAALGSLLREHAFGPLVAHGSYTMNLSAANPETRANGIDMIRKDLEKMELLPGQLYNFHPGCHVGQGKERGIALIAEALNEVMRPDMRTVVLLETMAGKGTEIGGCFEELREIIDRVECRDRIGVCLDTCHVWDAGYDLAEKPDEVLNRFDQIVGLSRLRAVHLNDSRNGLGSRKDRHEKLGKGAIGEDALRRIVRHPALQGLPFVLETPNNDEGYIREIRTVREWM